jgi:hypothetical protein
MALILLLWASGCRLVVASEAGIGWMFADGFATLSR